MEKYLNMKEQFGLPVYSLKRSQVSTKLMDCDGYEIESFYNSEYAEYAAHAINSHDELVEEVGRLRESLSELMGWTLKNAKAEDCYPYNAAHRLLNR